MEEKRPRWSSRTKLIVILLLVVLFIYLLFRFSSVLTPLILSIILAYILSPLVNLLQNRLRIRRGFATFLVYLLILFSIAAGLMLIIPPLASQVRGLDLDIQRFLRGLSAFLGHRYVIAGQVIDLDAFIEQATNSMQGLLQPFFGQTLGLALEVITSLVWVVFIVVVSFYLIKDGAALRQWFESLAPLAYRSDYTLLREEISHIWAAFFRGQLVLGLVVATLFTMIGLILGLPFALAMGVLAGLLEFLPSVGHGIWLLAASLLALFAGSTWLPIPNWVFMLVVIGLHLVYQQFDLNYLIPRIIGRSVHLPPLVVILGIVTGAVLAGVLGILLAAPTIASARVIGRYTYANLFDLEPFPVSLVQPLPPPNPRWWRKLLSKK